MSSNATLSDSSTSLSFEVVHLPHDGTTFSRYVNIYKAFRLLSLKIAPEAFASTYERESAFSDNVWNDRLGSPLSNTFAAVYQEERILSALTMLGPLPYGPLDINPLADPRGSMSGEVDKTKPLHFRVMGVFTMPEARRRGINKVLISKAIEFTKAKSSVMCEKGMVITCVVESDNIPARSLYEKCGFVVIKEIKSSSDGPGHLGGVFLLEYKS